MRKVLAFLLIFCIGVTSNLIAGERLGIYAINTQTDQTDQTDQIFSYHANQRFPLCSTSKLMVVAAVLKGSMTQKGLLNKKVCFTNEQLNAVGYAPITKQHLKRGIMPW